MTFADREGWERLPALLDECVQRWDLQIMQAFPNLTYGYVAPVVRADGTEAVLKIVLPNKEFRTEIAALRLYDGRNSVRLLEADAEQGILLLERLTPGTVLSSLAGDDTDDVATAIAASVMRGVWRPVPSEHEFPYVSDWAEGMQRLRKHFGGGPFSRAIVEEADSLFTELLVSAAAPVVLHGDLHHDNILAAQRQDWLAIDPKGVIGEPAYEVGALVRNLWAERHPRGNPSQLLERRVHQLAEELGIDRARIRGWGVAQAVLSSWWCIEDGGDDWESSLAVAELLSAIKT